MAATTFHERSMLLSATLVGQIIRVARYLTDEEMVQMGWDTTDEPGIVFILNDRTQIIVQRDGEGNGPGRFLVTSPKNENTIM